MQEKHLFEYATIRLVPCVERGEFLNVGVILFCQSKGFLQVQYQVLRERISIFNLKTDMEDIESSLLSFERICQGQREGGPIGKLPAATRFRWMTAHRSTIIQTSPVHSGLCLDPHVTLNKLFQDLVC